MWILTANNNSLCLSVVWSAQQWSPGLERCCRHCGNAWVSLHLRAISESVETLNRDELENHWLIEGVCQGPLFTGKAEHWGQTLGESLLNRSEAFLLRRQFLNFPLRPLHKNQRRHSRCCWVGVWRVPFPYGLHTVFALQAPLFLCSCSLCWLSLPLCL